VQWQGKLPAAKEFKLAERDKPMSKQEKPKSFMQELDEWTTTTVIGPLIQADPARETEASPEWERTVEQVQKAIREKVLDSYRNGQAAGPRPAKPVRREPRR
jgi:hypothetical protein